MSTRLPTCLLSITLFSAATVTHASAQTLADADLRVEPVVNGLALPTAMEFIGPDDFLVCEKDTGRLRRVTGGLIGPVVLDLPVANDVWRGLLGIAIHPRFAENGYVYLFYSRAADDGGQWLDNRVARFTWTGAALDPASETPIAVFPADAAQDNAPACEGGKILFGPDGKLYGSIGDLGRGEFGNPRIEQNTGPANSSYGGGIFRLNDDGTIPADNPFVAHENAAVQRLFAYGVRNSFGMDFDPRTDRLWDAEDGPEVYDELNYVRSGQNSGWLKIMGPDARNAAFEKNLHTAFDSDDLLMLAGAHYADPAFSFREPIGITAVAFLTGSHIPCHLQGRLLAGDTNFGRLYLFELNAARDAFVLSGAVADTVADGLAEQQSVAFGEGWGITTDLTYGPDGALYHLSLLDGAVRRIVKATPRADLDQDASVGISDLTILLEAFDISSAGDVNCDDITDLTDLAILLSEFSG